MEGRVVSAENKVCGAMGAIICSPLDPSTCLSPWGLLLQAKKPIPARTMARTMDPETALTSRRIVSDPKSKHTGGNPQVLLPLCINLWALLSLWSSGSPTPFFLLLLLTSRIHAGQSSKIGDSSSQSGVWMPQGSSRKTLQRVHEV